MSMISAQCDELRTMAESVGLAMPQAATLMMEAADTILSLRDSVHRERAEADRLREELEAVGIAAYSYGRGDLKAENAKLRELVEDMLDCIDIQIAFERVPARWMQDEFAGRARELGIEVD